MNAYAVVIGGVSAFIIGSGVIDLAKLENSLTFKFLVAFLIVFTFFSFFHTVRWTYAFECHRKRVNYLVSLMEPGSTSTIVWKDLDMYIPPMELLPNPRRIWKSLQKLIKFRQKCSKLWQRLKKSKECREEFKIRHWFFGLYLVMPVLFRIVFPETWSKLWQRFREALRTRYWFPALYFVVLILCAIVFSGSLQRLAFGCLGVALWLGTGFLFSEPR